jgi:hypothetical protein
LPNAIARLLEIPFRIESVNIHNTWSLVRRLEMTLHSVFENSKFYFFVPIRKCQQLLNLKVQLLLIVGKKFCACDI